MYFRKKHKLIVIITSLLFLIISSIGWLVIHQAVLLVALAVIVGLLLTYSLSMGHRMARNTSRGILRCPFYFIC